MPYVAAAVQAGIINGRTSDKFAPNATITRVEMAAMTARALSKLNGYRNVTDTQDILKQFADASEINASLAADVALAAKLGIVIGSNGSFLPNEHLTRAQAAVIICRLLSK